MPVYNIVNDIDHWYYAYLLFSITINCAVGISMLFVLLGLRFCCWGAGFGTHGVTQIDPLLAICFYGSHCELQRSVKLVTTFTVYILYNTLAALIMHTCHQPNLIQVFSWREKVAAFSAGDAPSHQRKHHVSKEFFFIAPQNSTGLCWIINLCIRLKHVMASRTTNRYIAIM